MHNLTGDIGGGHRGIMCTTLQGTWGDIGRVTMAQGKRNLEVHYSRQGKHKEFAKILKIYVLHREFNSNTGTIWR